MSSKHDPVVQWLDRQIERLSRVLRGSPDDFATSDALERMRRRRDEIERTFYPPQG
jgi:hypothetical protein